MRAATRQLAPWAGVACVLAAVVGWLELRYGFAFSDYDSEASAAFGAIAHGDLGGFLANVPSYGGSMVMRAPLAYVAGLFGAGDDTIYWAVSAPGLVALAALAAVLAAAARRRGAPVLACAVVVGLVVAAPPALQAVSFGHGEEALVAVLVVAAALAARNGRSVLAGLALGLAVAGKPWALVAAGPVLAGLPRGAWRAALVAGAVTAALLAPLALGSSNFARSAQMVATDTGSLFKPAQVWWFAGRHVHAAPGDGVPADARVAPGWLSRTGRPAMVLVAMAVSALWWLRRRRSSDVLGLLALVLLLRCALDPWDNLYYHLPFLLALVAWEVQAGRRWPLAAGGAALTMQATMVMAPNFLGRDLLAVSYLAWALPALALLGVAVFAPARARKLAQRTSALARRAAPSLVPAPASAPARG